MESRPITAGLRRRWRARLRTGFPIYLLTMVEQCSRWGMLSQTFSGHSRKLNVQRSPPRMENLLVVMDRSQGIQNGTTPLHSAEGTDAGNLCNQSLHEYELGD